MALSDLAEHPSSGRDPKTTFQIPSENNTLSTETNPISKVDTDYLSREGTTTPHHNIIQSKAFDATVQGFDDDVEPASRGARLMVDIVKHLQRSGVDCCFTREAALIYYGATRILLDWVLCIDDENLKTATTLLENLTDVLLPSSQSAMDTNGTIDHHFPRFKFRGYRCFFNVVPSWVHHLSCASECVEVGKSGLRFPTLDCFAQSLVETMNLVDLDDLVDGMDLTLDWGLKNLDLDGLTDVQWAVARIKFHEQHNESPPIFLESKGARKMDIWTRTASEEAKLRRCGHKAVPGSGTRFRRVNDKDPREVHDW